MSPQLFHVVFLAVVARVSGAAGADCAELAKLRGEQIFKETGDLAMVQDEVAKFTVDCRVEARDEAAQQAGQVSQLVRATTGDDNPAPDMGEHAAASAKAKTVGADASTSLAVAKNKTVEAEKADLAAGEMMLEVAETMASAEQLALKACKAEAEAQQTFSTGLARLLEVQKTVEAKAVQAATWAQANASAARERCETQELEAAQKAKEAKEATEAAEKAKAKADDKSETLSGAVSDADSACDDDDIDCKNAREEDVAAKNQDMKTDTMGAAASQMANDAAAGIAATGEKLLKTICGMAKLLEDQAKLASDTVIAEREQMKVLQAKIDQAEIEKGKKWDAYNNQISTEAAQAAYVQSNKTAVDDLKEELKAAERAAGAATFSASAKDTDAKKAASEASELKV